jgi:predicted dienelactone hydrolase
MDVNAILGAVCGLGLGIAGLAGLTQAFTDDNKAQTKYMAKITKEAKTPATEVAAKAIQMVKNRRKSQMRVFVWAGLLGAGCGVALLILLSTGSGSNVPVQRSHRRSHVQLSRSASQRASASFAPSRRRRED